MLAILWTLSNLNYFFYEVYILLNKPIRSPASDFL